MSNEAIKIGEQPIVVSSAAEDLSLKQWTIDDSAEIFDLMHKNAEYLGQTGFEYFVSKFKTKDHLDKDILSSPKLSFGIWDSGKLSGAIEMAFYDDEPAASITYWIGQNSTGKNLASRATRALASFSFDELGLTRLEASTNFVNIASARSLQKAGFRLYGESSIAWMFKLDNPKFKSEDPKPVVKEIKKLTNPKNPIYCVSLLELAGINRPTINHGSITKYIVEKGDVAFAIHNAQGKPEPIKHLQQGEKITIPRGHRYQDIGWAVLKAISVPPSNPSKIEYL